MKVKTFRADTMVEALAQAKRAFGADAVILNTRTVRRGGVLGMRGKDTVEITAARDGSDLPPAVARGRVPAGSGQFPRADGAASRVTPATSPSNDQADSLRTLRLEIGELKSIVRDLICESRQARHPDIPEELLAVYQRLVGRRVADKLAREIVQRVQGNLGADRMADVDAVRREMARELEAMLPASGPILLDAAARPTVIALVGPTGVGKTTTVAKLAANQQLVERREVGLITLDTYRIGAVEQLKTYANILNVPLEVVASPEQLRDAVARLSRCDVVFLDTAGRSPRDTVRIEELTRFFEVVRPHETHLVLSGTSGDAEMKEAMKEFSPVGIDRVILTKLDEAVGFGVILECLKQANATLSYITTGQDVPHDILLAESDALAHRLCGEETVSLSPGRMPMSNASMDSHSRGRALLA